MDERIFYIEKKVITIFIDLNSYNEFDFSKMKYKLLWSKV